MSFASKAKGWRQITINNQKFRWRFSPSEKGCLVLQGPASDGHQVIVSLKNWFDPWLLIGAAHSLPNEPRIITAKFARQAITFALANGWKPTQPGVPLRIEHENKAFTVTPAPAKFSAP